MFPFPSNGKVQGKTIHCVGLFGVVVFPFPSNGKVRGK